MVMTPFLCSSLYARTLEQIGCGDLLYYPLTVMELKKLDMLGLSNILFFSGCFGSESSRLCVSFFVIFGAFFLNNAIFNVILPNMIQ